MLRHCSAVVGNHTDIVTWLIEHGANVDHQEKHRDSPLSIAVDENYTTMARLLVEKGADVHKHALLHNAAYRGKIQELSLLLDLGVDLLGEIGFTPLEWAITGIITEANKDLAVLQYLIDRQANINAQLACYVRSGKATDR